MWIFFIVKNALANCNKYEVRRIQKWQKKSCDYAICVFLFAKRTIGVVLKPANTIHELFITIRLKHMATKRLMTDIHKLWCEYLFLYWNSIIHWTIDLNVDADNQSYNTFRQIRSKTISLYKYHKIWFIINCVESFNLNVIDSSVKSFRAT